MAEEENKMKLFDSNDEDDGSVEDDFKIRPQYQGPHGLEILEMNTQLSKRFKLDERFAEESDSDNAEKAGAENLSNENEEKMKNIRILESVLGHEVVKQSADKKMSRKQLLRYDPDDENASKFVKTSEDTEEKPRKSKKKKAVVEVEETLPVSTERYVEVCSNLKDILNTSTPFSFSNKFSCDSEEPVATAENRNDDSKISEDVEMLNVEKKKNYKQHEQDAQPKQSNINPFVPKSKFDTFFIKEDDSRLKEGVEFFKRPKSIEAIRVEWQKRREHVLELFRKKKRSQRSHSTRVKTVQMKNMIRKSNFKY